MTQKPVFNSTVSKLIFLQSWMLLCKGNVSIGIGLWLLKKEQKRRGKKIEQILVKRSRINKLKKDQDTDQNKDLNKGHTRTRTRTKTGTGRFTQKLKRSGIQKLSSNSWRWSSRSSTKWNIAIYEVTKWFYVLATFCKTDFLPEKTDHLKWLMDART